MGKAQSKPAAPPTPPRGAEATWDQNMNTALRETFGITATGGVFLTGVDAITLPMAFLAGSVIGAGVGVWRGGQREGDILRPALGVGTILTGLTLAVPPYVRMVYAPWLFISPQACAWAALTGGIVGVGIQMYNPPRENALVEPAEEAENFPITGSVAAFWGGSLIGAGLYLAAPGALRVAMMYGGS